MRELAGKLSALDPEASEAIKVVSYFDALIANRAGLDAIVRGAAVLSGAVAGAEHDGKVLRYDPLGERLESTRPVHSLTQQFGTGAVWLEREGDPLANDSIVLERFTFAAALLDAHGSDSVGLAVILDASRSFEERIAALARLRILPDARIRLIATDPGTARAGAMTTPVPTRYGVLQATLDLGDGQEPGSPAGLGVWTRADHAPESWESAVLALCVSTPRTPVIDATTFGAVAGLIRNYDPDAPHQDVLLLQKLDRQTAEILRVLVEADSIRGAAAELAMHHSTLQARHDNLTEYLGYDPRSIEGRMRYCIAELLRRISARA